MKTRNFLLYIRWSLFCRFVETPYLFPHFAKSSSRVLDYVEIHPQKLWGAFYKTTVTEVVLFMELEGSRRDVVPLMSIQRRFSIRQLST